MTSCRTVRTSVRDVTEGPTDRPDQVAQNILEAAQLPFARQLAEWVKNAMAGGYGLKQSEAIRTADGKMPRDQRLYDSEIIGASYILSQETRFNDFNSWVLLFNNNLGWRRVDYTACRYGYIVDPVTRECVRIEEAQPGPDVIEPPALKIDDKKIEDAGLLDDKEKQKISLTGWVLIGIVGAVIVSALLGGKR